MERCRALQQRKRNKKTEKKLKEEAEKGRTSPHPCTCSYPSALVSRPLVLVRSRRGRVRCVRTLAQSRVHACGGMLVLSQCSWSSAAVRDWLIIKNKNEIKEIKEQKKKRERNG